MEVGGGWSIGGGVEGSVTNGKVVRRVWRGLGGRGGQRPLPPPAAPLQCQHSSGHVSTYKVARKGSWYVLGTAVSKSGTPAIILPSIRIDTACAASGGKRRVRCTEHAARCPCTPCTSVAVWLT